MVTYEVSERVYELLEKYCSGHETLEEFVYMGEIERGKRPLFNQIKYPEFAAEMKKYTEYIPKIFELMRLQPDSKRN